MPQNPFRNEGYRIIMLSCHDARTPPNRRRASRGADKGLHSEGRVEGLAAQ